MEMHELCPALKNFIVSSAYEFGEGEKKITENILQHKRSGKYVIFSPDSDMILLSIIIHNKLKRLNIDTDFNILKYNSIDKKIEYISIKDLMNNLFEITYSKLNSFRKFKHDRLNIMDDLVCIFTFFGNDFLPKIESINMKNGIDILISLYIKNFNHCRAKHPYILSNDNDTTRINMSVFIDYLSILSESEEKLLFDKYISAEFKNFSYISNIFGRNEYTPFFIDKLNRYCHGFNKVVRYIKLNPEKSSEEVHKNIVEKFTDKDDWEKIFMSIENKDNQYGSINITEMLDIIIKSIRDDTKYRLGLKLVRTSDNILDKFHQNNMIGELPHPAMNICEYDIEMYKLDKRIDEYKSISMELDEKIGIVDMKYKDNEYKIHTDRNIVAKKDYFYASIMKLDNPDNINNFVGEYLKGFFWVIDFYFNKTHRITNINNISIWSYNYTHTPYFKEIINYIYELNNVHLDLGKLFISVSDISGMYYVSPFQYINTLEQYIYVTPKHLLKNNIPEIYKELLSDEKIFLDIDNFYEKIRDGNIELLESFDAKNMNKINITGFRKSSYTDFMARILPLRRINDFAPFI